MFTVSHSHNTKYPFLFHDNECRRPGLGRDMTNVFPVEHWRAKNAKDENPFLIGNGRQSSSQIPPFFITDS